MTPLISGIVSVLERAGEGGGVKGGPQVVTSLVEDKSVLGWMVVMVVQSLRTLLPQKVCVESG